MKLAIQSDALQQMSLVNQDMKESLCRDSGNGHCTLAFRESLSLWICCCWVMLLGCCSIIPGLRTQRPHCRLRMLKPSGALVPARRAALAATQHVHLSCPALPCKGTTMRLQRKHLLLQPLHTALAILRADS